MYLQIQTELQSKLNGPRTYRSLSPSHPKWLKMLPKQTISKVNRLKFSWNELCIKEMKVEGICTTDNQFSASEFSELMWHFLLASMNQSCLCSQTVFFCAQFINMPHKWYNYVFCYWNCCCFKTIYLKQINLQHCYTLIIQKRVLKTILFISLYVRVSINANSIILSE